MAGILKRADLAIIVPIINCLDYLTGFLPTIKTNCPYNLIIINNASNDETYQYLEALKKEEKAIIFHFTENAGVATSWNFGMKYAIRKFNAKYFFIPNNDTLFHSEAIDELIKAIDSKSIGLATATDVSGRVTAPVDVLSLKMPLKSNFKDTPDFSGFMLKKSTLERVGYFDEKFYPAYFEDNDYHYRLGLAGLRGVSVNRALYFHYGSRTIKENESIRAKSNLGYTANRDYYIQKWGGEPGKEKYLIPFGDYK